MEKETDMSTSFDSIKRGLLEAIEHALKVVCRKLAFTAPSRRT